MQFHPIPAVLNAAPCPVDGAARKGSRKCSAGDSAGGRGVDAGDDLEVAKRVRGRARIGTFPAHEGGEGLDLLLVGTGDGKEPAPLLPFRPGEPGELREPVREVRRAEHCVDHALLSVQPELLAVPRVPRVAVVDDHSALEMHQDVDVSGRDMRSGHVPHFAAEKADEIEVVHRLLHDFVVRQEVVRQACGRGFRIGPGCGRCFRVEVDHALERRGARPA